MFTKKTTVKSFGYQLNSITTNSASRISSVLNTIVGKGTSTIPVVDQGNLVGILSLSDILRVTEDRDKYVVSEVMTKSVISLHESDELSKVFQIFINKQYNSNQSVEISTIPIIDARERFLGLITYKDVLMRILPFVGKRNVGSIFNSTREMVVVEEDDTIETVFFIMAQKGIRQILVVDKRKKRYVPVGVVTDEDVFRNMSNNENELVRDVMMELDHLKILTPRHLLPRLIRLLTDPKLGLKLFPLVKKNELLGIVSYTDIFREFLHDLNET